MARRQHTVSLKVSDDQATEKVFNQIRGLAGKEPGEIRLFGSDPLLRPDISSIVTHAKETGFQHVSVVTNGVSLGDKGVAASLHEAGLNEVALTLYSVDSRVHDALTRQKGSHEKVMQALDALGKTELDVRVQIPIDSH